MDDTKTIDNTYKVVVGETEYEFASPDPKLIERMILVSHMNADASVTLEACTKWLAVAAGPVTWSAIMRRFMAGEVTAEQILGAMTDLVRAWSASKGAAVDAA